MIDTVILEVPISSPATQKLIDEDTFPNWTPNLKAVMNGFWEEQPATKCVLNPTKKAKLSWGYQPRLTALKQLVCGGFKWFLYIEFSAQKLLFGNNYQEVNDGDFNDICKKLEVALKSNGVNLSVAEIKKTTCKTIHYAKNCLYDTNLHDVILELHKGTYNPRHTVNTLTQYVRGGISFNVGIPDRTIAFYDKNAELAKSLKSGHQPTITQAHMKKINRKKVLRVEYRLNSKYQIKRVLGMSGFSVSTKPTFEEVFGEKQAKAAILYELNQIENEWFGAMAIKDVETAKRFIDSHILTKPAMSELATAGLLATHCGVREARLSYGYRWRKVSKDSKKISFPPNQHLQGVVEKIKDFTLIRKI